MLEFLAYVTKLAPVQECLVRGLLYGRKARPIPKIDAMSGGNGDCNMEEEEYCYPNAKCRNGDHLMGIPFEYVLCHFRNMNYQDPLLPCDPNNAFTLV